MKKISFEAYDYKFSTGQIQDIKNMSVHADNYGLKLHEVLVLKPLASKDSSHAEERAYIKKPIWKCPKCGGVLKVFSMNKKELVEHPGMNSKFECCKTCKGGGCGYKEFSIKEVEQIIEEVENVSS